MRVQRSLYLLGALLVAELALAKMPFTSEVFGKLEGTLDYCGQIDSPSAAKYQQKRKDLVKDIPENEVVESRKTEEYKTGYQWISDELPKMPKDEIVGACAASLENKN